MKATTKLRQLLREEKCLHLGPSWDCLSAALAKEAGFKALHITGMGMEATQLGSPDMGLITMSEVVNHVGHMTMAVDVPFITDMEAGWGNVVNVDRSIKELERAGVAGVHLEDQATPKKCPVMEGRKILSREEAVGKVKAALNARTDPDFVIVARSDADAISFDELIVRLNLYLEAGADLVMQAGIYPMIGKMPPDEQMYWLARIPKEVNGPVMGLFIPKGYTIKDMAEAGYKIFMSPTESFVASIFGMKEALKEAVVTGVVDNYMAKHHPDYDGGTWIMPMWNMLGFQRYLGIEKLMADELAKAPQQ